jgi:hypothetical protein
MHTDQPTSADGDAIVASALARGVPVVSAKQMLNWVDGRNQSAFGPMTWAGNVLTFNVIPGSGANGLQVMVPTQQGALHLSGITLDGAPVISPPNDQRASSAFVTVAVGQCARHRAVVRQTRAGFRRGRFQRSPARSSPLQQFNHAPSGALMAQTPIRVRVWRRWMIRRLLLAGVACLALGANGIQAQTSRAVRVTGAAAGAAKP